MRQVLLCLSILAAAVVKVHSEDAVRGVAPDLLPKYSFQGGKFECLSGGQQFPATRVNDDYCDCIDGSDEPGTSACSNGHFYCHNKGYLPKLLNASAVDDGVCDCCDGSDEASGKCPSTCKEAGAEYRAALKAKSTSMKIGLKAKEKYVSKAATKKAEWQQEVEQLRSKKAALQQEVNDLKARKEKIEKEEEKERAAEEALRKQIEAAQNLKQPEPESSEQTSTQSSAQLEAEQEAPVDKAAPSKISDLVEDTPPQDQRQTEVQSTDSVAEGSTAEGSVTNEEPLSAEEQGRRIASQWTRDPEASGHSEPAEAFSEGELTDNDPGVASKPEVPKYSVPDMSSLHKDASEAATQPKMTGLLGRLQDWVSSKLGWNFISKLTPKSDRQKVKDEFLARDQALSELDRRQSELEGNLGNDSGPDNVFLTLLDRCFEANVEKYVYEVCPFKTAAQKDGGMSTSLGSWHGFDNDYRAMVFQNGQHCWNGPNRSLRVDLECGAKEEVSRVEEPNRCEYRARMTTPAACLAEDSQKLQKLIGNLDNTSAKEEL